MCQSWGRRLWSEVRTWGLGRTLSLGLALLSGLERASRGRRKTASDTG